jgi:hypothetical protein
MWSIAITCFVFIATLIHFFVAVNRPTKGGTISVATVCVAKVWYMPPGSSALSPDQELATIRLACPRALLQLEVWIQLCSGCFIVCTVNLRDGDSMVCFHSHCGELPAVHRCFRLFSKWHLVIPQVRRCLSSGKVWAVLCKLIEERLPEISQVGGRFVD